MKCSLSPGCKRSDLLSVAMQWLDYHGVKGTSGIRSSVSRMMPCDFDSSDLYGSRRSLFRLVLLFVPDILKRDFVNEFLQVY